MTEKKEIIGLSREELQADRSEPNKSGPGFIIRGLPILRR